MPQKLPIQDHYVSSVPIVPPACDAMALHYDAPEVLACDMNRLYPVIRSCIADFNKNNALNIKFSYGAVYIKDGKQRLDCTFVNQDAAGNYVPLKSSQLKALAYALAGNGCITQEASKYIRDCCEGAIIPPPLPTTPPTPAPPAPMPVASAQSAVPSLKKHYANAAPKAGSLAATLGLTYILNGPFLLNGSTTNASVNNDYTVMRAAIQQAIADYNIANVTQIDALIAYPKATTNTIPSEFDVSFSKPPAYSQLSLHELHGVADALQQAGCLQTQEAQAFKNAAAAQVPLLQITGPAISPSIQNQGGQLALIPKHYKEAKAFVGTNSLSVRYTMKGPVNLPNVVTDYNHLKTVIEYATRLIPTRPDGSEIVVYVTPLSSQSAAGGGLTEARFMVKFDRKMQSSTKRLQQQDMTDISTSLQSRQCLTGQEAQQLNASMLRAMSNSGWSNTP